MANNQQPNRSAKAQQQISLLRIGVIWIGEVERMLIREDRCSLLE
jgi:hypothetical protein